LPARNLRRYAKLSGSWGTKPIPAISRSARAGTPNGIYRGMHFGLSRGGRITTMDSITHDVGKWDLLIAHPPCTYLTITGNRWLNCERYGAEAQSRWNNRCLAACFFLAIAYADCPRIAIENPVGCMSTYFRRPDQIVQPWQFALTEEEQTEKQTCFWLKGLNPLVPTINKKPEMTYHEWTTHSGKKKRQSLWYYKTRCLPHSQRSSAASKTFPGIARAMAEQWGGDIRGLRND